MRIKAKRQKKETLQQFLRRFLTRFQKSGLAIEVKKNMYRSRPMNERRKKEYRMYRLKIQSFINKKMKEGWPLEKALDMARRYIQYIKYEG
jgi:ribosomal protein S21